MLALLGAGGVVDSAETAATENVEHFFFCFRLEVGFALCSVHFFIP